MTKVYTFDLKTDEQAFYNITAQVKQAISDSGVKEGICLVYCPHTTAAITINENADEYVAKDVIFAMKKVFPRFPEFRHDEGNSDGHVKCSVLGASETLIVTDGKPILGRWQDVYFAEFDPPRSRNFFVKVIEG
ncbi:MAG: secondary thiamine-phosphate synthase enzyme YjbQ [Clostridia bacterium]|nr:secondary thiamine-phosphate synthase enzyme YjbQ [Clostridia bacterium]